MDTPLFWLQILLWPGLIGSIASLIWLNRRGVRRGKTVWMLAALSVLWVLAVLLTLLHWSATFLGISLAFAISTYVIAILSNDNHNQRAEVARLRRIADVRADRVSALSHEIRTPLAMIKGATDLLLEGNPGPLTLQQLTFLQTISSNCENTISLAEDLLVQARIEAGLFKLRLEQVDLKVLTRQVVLSIERISTEREQVFHVDYPQVMENIYVDPRLIRQALYNLLQNASRHTSMGGHIYVTLAENDAGVVISVMDDGAGMSAEDRRRLFRRFSSGRPLGDGTGLGLVITKQIIELHGGQIMVDTSLGRGTTVLFTLPRWRIEHE